jgi:hypothetical protein
MAPADAAKGWLVVGPHLFHLVLHLRVVERQASQAGLLRRAWGEAELAELARLPAQHHRPPAPLDRLRGFAEILRLLRAAIPVSAVLQTICDPVEVLLADRAALPVDERVRRRVAPDLIHFSKHLWVPTRMFL